MERVAIVVADKDFREILALCIERRGFPVSAFEDSTSIMQYLKANGRNVGAVVVDIGLPSIDECSGDELAVCEKVAGINPRAHVIVLTADGRRMGEGQSARFRTLLKPVAMDNLCAEFDRALVRPATTSGLARVCDPTALLVGCGGVVQRA